MVKPSDCYRTLSVRRAFHGLGFCLHRNSSQHCVFIQCATRAIAYHCFLEPQQEVTSFVAALQVVQPLLQSPVAASTQQQATAASGLSQIAAALAALAEQAVSQPSRQKVRQEDALQLARAITATVAAAVAPLLARPGTALTAMRAHLDRALDRALAAVRVLVTAARETHEQGPAPLLLSAVLEALQSPAASAPQLAALQGLLARLAPQLAASHPQLLAAVAGSLVRAAEMLSAQAAATDAGGGSPVSVRRSSGGRPAAGALAVDVSAAPQLQAALQALMQVGAALPGPKAAGAAAPAAGASPLQPTPSPQPADQPAAGQPPRAEGAAADHQASHSPIALKRPDSPALAEDGNGADAPGADAAPEQPNADGDTAGAAGAEEPARSASDEWPDDFEGGDSGNQMDGAAAGPADALDAAQNGHTPPQPAGPHAAALAAARSHTLQVWASTAVCRSTSLHTS